MNLDMRVCWIVAIIVASMGQVARGDVENPYRFERRDRYYRDLVQLVDGGKRLGKVLEWADRVMVYRADGTPTVLNAADVNWIEFRRERSDAERAVLPDLTVAYVEQIPRATSWQGNITMKDGVPTLASPAAASAGRPPKGEDIRFRVHVLNAGNKASSPVSCDAAVDGEWIGKSERIPALKPGEEYIADFTWKWSDDATTLTVTVDKAGRQAEWLRWNNELNEPLRGLAVAVAVSRKTYDAFKTRPNLVDSFCFEDYARFNLNCFNGLLAASRHPASPDGVVERVRFDRLIIADDVTPTTLRRQLVNDRGLAEYDALLVLDPPADDEATTSLGGLRVDWPALKRLGAGLGLVDAAALETQLSDCDVYDKFGRPAIVRHIPAGRASLMRQPGPFPLSEVDAAYLNRVAGHPRGLQGEYLYQLPDSVVLEVVGANGAPVSGATIDVFQLSADEPGRRTIGGPSGSDPWVAVVTDEAGRAPLPNRPAPTGETPNGYKMKPNPFGDLALDGSNGLLLLRVRQGDGKSVMEAFEFLSVSTCNAAWLHGQKREFVYRIQTQFADLPRDESSVPRLPYAFFYMPTRDSDHPDLTVAWPVSSGIDLSKIAEYRVYRKTGFGGIDTNPWTLVATVPQPVNKPANNQCPQPYFDQASSISPGSLDTWFAVSIADLSGREGALSEPAFIPHGKEVHELAIRDNAAYITLSGDGPPIMLYFDAVAGTQAYLPRTARFPGYAPHYEGICFGRKGLIVTDPVNNILAVYDTSRGRHELIETIPSRDAWPGPPSFFDGEFNAPADVASDADGNLYVADRGNHRVQILSAEGHFKSLLDPDFRFNGPHAIAYSFGRICVTDNNGTRVRVYDVRGGEPKFVMELPPMVDADRALVNIKGQVVVTGRVAAGEPWAVQVFAQDGPLVKPVASVDQMLMGQCYAPRGLYQHEGQQHLGYFVNSFPFDVRAITIGNPPGEK